MQLNRNTWWVDLFLSKQTIMRSQIARYKLIVSSRHMFNILEKSRLIVCYLDIVDIQNRTKAISSWSRNTVFKQIWRSYLKMMIFKRRIDISSSFLWLIILLHHEKGWHNWWNYKINLYSRRWALFIAITLLCAKKSRCPWFFKFLIFRYNINVKRLEKFCYNINNRLQYKKWRVCNKAYKIVRISTEKYEMSFSRKLNTAFCILSLMNLH